MAEQKTEDTKPAAARRGARPFVGPAGGAAAARPLLKPAGPPARHAPFAPPLVSDRTSLGTPRPEPRAALPAHPPTPMPTLQPSAPEPAWAPPAETRNPRSITSEMVAIDAFAAFDSVWGPSNTPVATPAIDAAPSHVDEEALGCGADGHQAWAEEITAGQEAGTPSAMDAVSSPEPDAMSMQWTPGSTAAIAMPSWLADDANDIAPAAAVSDAAAADVGGAVDAFEAVAKTLGTPDEASAFVAALDEPLVTTADLTVDLPVETLAVADVVAEPVVATEAQPVLDHGAAPDLRVVAALDRLAERVRAGEIDVSSVAPDAPDAAVLASVLAALLGGSRSR